MIAALARAVRSGRRSAGDLIDEALERAGQAEALNVFTLVEGTAARARAAAIDAEVRAGGDPGPLAGVPVALKDLIDHAGRPTTCGSSFLRRPATSTATVVQRLEAAGAVIVGRAGLHEFAYGFSSENDWWGPVRNPWDPATSPGGSSGGSAAAVAAGIALLGIGTDTGGSVRVPAALCECVGLKVTHGRIPLTGVFPLAPSLDTVGPITRSIDDAAAAYRALAGHDPRDRWSAKRHVEPPPETPPGTLAGTRVGIPMPWTERPVDPTIAAAHVQVIEGLAALGARVAPLRAPSLDPSRLPPAAYAEVADVHRAWFTEDPDRYGAAIRGRAEATLRLGEGDAAAARAWRADLVQAGTDAFAEADVLVTPTTATRRKSIGDPQVEVGDHREAYRPALAWFTSMVNQLGVPAISLPVTGFDPPAPSVQLIAPWWAEARLISISLALEAAGVVAPGRLADGTW